MTSRSPTYTIESVENALRVLLMLRERPSVRVTDVSDELKVARSTAHRLLATLMHHDFVSQDRLTRAYRAGRVFVEIGLAAVGDLDVRRKAHQHMELVSQALGETVNLLVLEGSGCRFVDGVECDRAIRVSLRTGALLPAHTTSGGKVLLAELDREELRALYPQGLPGLTERTITTFEDLDRELALVRQRGYALNIGESEVALHAVAVPIRDRRGGVVAALAVSSPADRMSAREVPDAVRVLTAAATEIGSTLV